MWLKPDEPVSSESIRSTLILSPDGITVAYEMFPQLVYSCEVQIGSLWFALLFHIEFLNFDFLPYHFRYYVLCYQYAVGNLVVVT